MPQAGESEMNLEHAKNRIRRHIVRLRMAFDKNRRQTNLKYALNERANLKEIQHFNLFNTTKQKETK
jgi:hypothetical protein